MDGLPTTEYARNGEVHLAYQVLGEGPLDIVVIESWVHHVEAFWEIPELARQRRRLASLGRVIIFDRRGTGMSDPVALDRLPDLETQVADICAVMDAAGSTRAAILGLAEGGPLAVLLAASLPERCRALVLFNTAARLSAAPDYPWGAPEERLLEIVRRQAQSWATGDGDHLAHLAPSRVDDPRFTEQLVHLGRGAVSPGAVAHYFRQTVLTDVRDLLPAIQAPTLVLQRAHDQIAGPELGRYLADHDSWCPIRGARWRRPLLVPRPCRRTRRRDRGVPHWDSSLSRPGPTARDRPLHRHRRLHRSGGRGRRHSLARAAGRARQHRAPTTGTVRRTRDRQHRRRVPGDVRPAGECHPLRQSDRHRARAHRAGGPGGRAHRRGRGTRRADRWSLGAHRRPGRRHRRRWRHRRLEHRQGLAGGLGLHLRGPR